MTNKITSPELKINTDNDATLGRIEDFVANDTFSPTLMEVMPEETDEVGALDKYDHLTPLSLPLKITTFDSKFLTSVNGKITFKTKEWDQKDGIKVTAK